MKYFILLILFVSCASPKKKTEIDLDNISDQDFKKPNPISYNSNDDYFKNIDSEETQLLNDESIARIEDLDDISDDDLFTNIARSCYEKEFSKAWDIIRQSYDKYRKNPVFWNQVGNCYLRKKNYRKALLYYNKSLENKKNYVPALNNIGVMYWNRGEHQKALVAFKRASKFGNFSKTPRFNLALLYLEFGLSDKAISNLENLIRLGRKDKDVKTALASAYLMKKEFNKAISYCNQLEDHFDVVYIGLNCSLAYKMGNKTDKAQDIYLDIDSSRLGPWKNYYQSLKGEIL